jgi:hypothetical protein
MAKSSGKKMPMSWSVGFELVRKDFILIPIVQTGGSTRVVFAKSAKEVQKIKAATISDRVDNITTTMKCGINY